MSNIDLHSWISTDVAYVLLLFTLFVAPKFLQRYRLPSAVTALAFGAVAGIGFGVLRDDPTVQLISTLGIVSLFLFAGLDVDLASLRAQGRVLGEHVAVTALSLTTLAWVLARLFGVEGRASALVALAVFTPSTGFILDSLGRWGLTVDEAGWIRAKAIATEIVALAVLFIVVQSTSAARLGLSAVVLLGLIALLPLVFRWFARVVVPHAPKSEFGFLMMVAVVVALATRALGVYYLVGAFAVGMAAQQFRAQLPALASERMIGTVEAFASLFVPFYFFHAGVELRADDFSLRACLYGLAFVVVILPLRAGLVLAHRKLRLPEGEARHSRVAVALLPTTVFTLVLAEILRDQFAAPPALFGALVVYALFDTLLPGFYFRAPTPSFEEELQHAGTPPAA